MKVGHVTPMKDVKAKDHLVALVQRVLVKTNHEGGWLLDRIARSSRRNRNAGVKAWHVVMDHRTQIGARNWGLEMNAIGVHYW